MIVNYDRHMFIVQATGAVEEPLKYMPAKPELTLV